MNELEIFRYALFPSGANYSDADLKKRVTDSTHEIKVLLGEGGGSVDYSILYKYSNDQDYLWLVAVATNSIQRSLKLLSEQETITGFAQRIQDRISSLPIVLNSIALEIDAQRFNATPSIFEDKQLVSLVLKQSGKRQKIKQNGEVQELLFPECDPFKLEPEPRLVRFKIHSLSKYEAVICEIEDPYSIISRSSKMSLIFGANNFNQEVFNRLADRLYQGGDMHLIVNAKVEMLDGGPVEYHFYSEVMISNGRVGAVDS